MKEQPLFSILMANYNNGHFIMEAVESVLKQNYSNWELIIYDDGSKDNSVDIIHAIQDTRVRYVLSEDNSGVAHAKKSCIMESKGKYCGFLDPDDLLDRQALKVMVDHLEKNPKLSLVYSDFILSDLTTGQSQFVHQKNYDNLELMTGLHPNHFSAFKRQAYLNTAGINPNLKKAVDRDLVMKLEEVGDVLHISDVLYHYRVTNKSISNNANTFEAEYWAWIARFDACDRRGLDKAVVFDKVRRALYPYQFDEWIHKSSTEYRIGSMIVKPLRKIKHFILGKN